MCFRVSPGQVTTWMGIDNSRPRGHLWEIAAQPSRPLTQLRGPLATPAAPSRNRPLRHMRAPAPFSCRRHAGAAAAPSCRPNPQWLLAMQEMGIPRRHAEVRRGHACVLVCITRVVG